MGMFDFITTGVRELSLARPEAKRDELVFKHPAAPLPLYAELELEADEAALFVREGAIVGALRAVGVGQRHLLTPANIPFLAQGSGAPGALDAELYFVTMRPTYDVPFAGELGLIEDPLLGEMIAPRIQGTFSFLISDPVAFLAQYLGRPRAGSNDEVLAWIKGLLLHGVHALLGEVLVEQQTSMLQLTAMQQTLALRFAQNAPDLQQIGCRILGMGEFEVRIDDDDRARLLAAQAEISAAKRPVQSANLGIAQAAAEAQQRQLELDQRFNQAAPYAHAGAGSAAAVPVADGLPQAGDVSASSPLGASPASSAANVQNRTCPACAREVPPGKYCSECGVPLTLELRVCGACGLDGATSARACASCGTAFAQPA